MLNDSQAIVAGRMWLGNQPKTGLWTLDLENRQLKRKLLLPSAGDSSYPGLVLSEDKLLVSYYSSHKDGKSNIYLAQISVNGWKSNKVNPVTLEKVAWAACRAVSCLLSSDTASA